LGADQRRTSVKQKEESRIAHGARKNQKNKGKGKEKGERFKRRGKGHTVWSRVVTLSITD